MIITVGATEGGVGKTAIAPTAATDFIAAAPDAAKKPKTIGKPMGRRPHRQGPKDAMRMLNIKVENANYEAFFDACIERGETMTAVIRRAIQVYIQKHTKGR